MKHDPRSSVDRAHDPSNRFPPTGHHISEVILRKTLSKMHPDVVRARRVDAPGKGWKAWFLRIGRGRNPEIQHRFRQNRRPLLWLLLVVIVVGTVFAMVYTHVNGGSNKPDGARPESPESSRSSR